jgi:hypothetical protein
MGANAALPVEMLKDAAVSLAPRGRRRRRL